MTRILLLGGTHEARKLATELASQGHDVTTSLAGRTKEPIPLDGTVRIGGFGGVENMVQWMSEHKIEKLIDATHPFATKISANAKIAANMANIPLERYTRRPWQKTSEDHWIDAINIEEVCNLIPKDARVLLALGSQHISSFSTRTDVFFLIRMIDKPKTPLPFENYALHLGRPSSNWKREAEILKEYAITHIVCRNSGGKATYAKIEAARNLCLPVIIISQPES